MFRLLEITYDGTKESQAIYPYEDAVTLEGDYESKLGQAMLNNTDELLIALDNIGKALFSGKVGSHDFAPRLFEAKTTTEEVADLAKYDDENTLHARFHTKKGAAIKNTDVKQEVLFGFANTAQLEYCQWVRPIIPVAEE